MLFKYAPSGTTPVSKYFHNSINNFLARATITNLMQFIKIAPVDQSTIEQALALDYRDFEDAVQMISAVQCKTDYLITRNVKDYQPALLTVLKPVEFMGTLRKKETE